jgi:hypothetical protein
MIKSRYEGPSASLGRLDFGSFSARLKRPETRRNKRTSPLKSLK